MIKKLTLATVATLALIMIPAQAESMKCQAGKCGAGMTEKSKSCDGKACNKKDKSCHKKKRGAGSPLLMPLPSPMRTLMKYENDAKLALTAEQKTKLADVRKSVMPQMKKLKGEMKVLTQEIKTACKAGSKVSDLKVNVEKLAKLKADATMVKLGCIAQVKEVLTDAQETFIKDLRKSRMAKIKAKTEKAMKCAAGKCGSKK